MKTKSQTPGEVEVEGDSAVSSNANNIVEVMQTNGISKHRRISSTSCSSVKTLREVVEVAVAPGVTHYQSRDLWAHTDNGTVAVAAGLSVMVEPSAVVMLKLTPMKQPAQ